MHMLNYVSLMLLGLLAVASASPLSIPKRSFKVDRVANDRFTRRNGPKALAKAYRKFGMSVPQGIIDTLAAMKVPVVSSPLHSRRLVGHSTNGTTNSTTGQTGTVEATPEENDIEYLAPVNIGGQTLNLDFDTGSSDLWVFSSRLSDSTIGGHTAYDPDASDTFSAVPGSQFQIRYGDGSGAVGDVGTDVVEVGGAVVQKQAVEMATEISGQFVEDTNNDGLLGLAFSSINTVTPRKQKTFFDNIKADLAEPVFTADLPRDAVGSYEFGTIDESKFKGDLTWIPVDSTDGFWQFSSESFSVDGKTQQGTPGAQAIADTGTTLIIADPVIVHGYYDQIEGAQMNQRVGGYTIPCDAQMPDLELDIGGLYMAKVAGKDLNYAEVDTQTCFGGLQPTAEGGLGVYGDLMFKSEFVAFHGGKTALGMAPNA